MNFPFPPALAAAIDSLLDGVSRKDLAVRAGKLSAGYRAGGTSHAVAGPLDVLAYLVARAPATFAAAGAVFARVRQVMPAFAPASLLDVGAGPGTAAWAARTAFPSLTAVTLLEHNPAFRQAAARLMPDAGLIAADLGAAKPQAALVVAVYVLAELPAAAAGNIARDLWQAAEEMLVLIEPGTPQGFARIRAARAALIDAGAHVAAPCTHDAACPMAGRVGDSRSDNKTSDWCHFSQRLARRRDHMIAKGATVPFEDERYSYVVAARQQPASGARIVKPPVEARPGLTVPLCDATGLRDAFVPRRDKAAFRAARKRDWGDLF